MMHFMRSGGVPMWFVLLFGGAALVGAILFARKPDEARLGVVRAMTLTTLFSALSGFVAGLTNVFTGCAHLPPDQRDLWPFYVLKGTSEASALLVLGFTLLALTWLTVAIGLRRLAARERAGL